MRQNIHHCCRKGELLVVEEYIERGGDLDRPDEVLQMTPLHWACAGGRLEVVELLLRRGANTTARDYQGLSPLHHSCHNGHLAVSRLLLTPAALGQRADVQARSENHKTPLHCASSGSEAELVELLLMHGAEVDSEDRDMRTPIYYATEPKVVELLISRGANAAHMNLGMWASKGSLADLECTRRCLEAGGDVGPCNSRKMTPLFLACRQGFLKLVELLLDYGSELEARDRWMRTPLHVACQFGHRDVVALLLRWGADPAAASAERQTPWDAVAPGCAGKEDIRGMLGRASGTRAQRWAGAPGGTQQEQHQEQQQQQLQEQEQLATAPTMVPVQPTQAPPHPVVIPLTGIVQPPPPPPQVPVAPDLGGMVTASAGDPGEASAGSWIPDYIEHPPAPPAAMTLPGASSPQHGLVAPGAEDGGGGKHCSNCTAQMASVRCQACGEAEREDGDEEGEGEAGERSSVLCATCDMVVHMKGPQRQHRRQPLWPGSQTPPGGAAPVGFGGGAGGGEDGDEGHLAGRVGTGPHLPYRDVQLLEKLGEGFYGVVYTGKWGGYQVAIKRLKHSMDAVGLESLYDEVKTLATLRHPCILSFYGVTTPPHTDERLIVMELMHESLDKLLAKEGGLLSEAARRRLAKDIAEGAKYMHGLNIVHRDMSTVNILVTGDAQHLEAVTAGKKEGVLAKLADFGLSRPMADHMTGATGNLRYMAPEVFQCGNYSLSADVYSYAFVVWEIFTGLVPFKGTNKYVVANKAANEKLRPAIRRQLSAGGGEDPTLGRAVPDDVADLLEKAWHPLPSERLSFGEIILLLGAGAA